MCPPCRGYPCQRATPSFHPPLNLHPTWRHMPESLISPSKRRKSKKSASGIPPLKCLRLRGIFTTRPSSLREVPVPPLITLISIHLRFQERCCIPASIGGLSHSKASASWW